MAAVAMCPAPVLVLPGSSQHVNERFYKFGTPSPQEQEKSPAVYSDLEDSGFHSDEEMQKVAKIVYSLFVLIVLIVC